MTKFGPVRQPTFFWQGILIICPAVLLAGFGLMSLRQDRLLAEHEAVQQARSIATNLVHSRLPAALLADQALTSEDSLIKAGSERPQDDPLLRLNKSDPPRIAFNAQHETLFPGEYSGWPDPQPLDLSELSAELLSLWTELSIGAAGLSDPESTLETAALFISKEPPNPFAACARYYQAVLLGHIGAVPESRRALEQLIAQHPDAVAESGVPLRLFASLRLLDFAQDPSEATRHVNALCSYAILNPSPVSIPLIGRVERMLEAKRGDREQAVQSIRSWVEIRHLHAQARELREVYLEELGSREGQPGALWLRTDSKTNWLAAVHPGGGGWVTAMDEDTVRRVVRDAVQLVALPEFLAVDVSIVHRPATDLSTGARLLFRESSGSLEPGVIPVEAAVYLTRPDMLYARQRARTIWFGALIGVAVAAVLAGFVAAWRAFKKQQQLSEMRSNFVSSVSHEIRSPIASVRLMAEELDAAGVLDRAKSKEYHRYIVQECQRLSALIENVLDFSRHEQGRKQYEFEPTDLAALAEETVRLMGTRAGGRQIDLRLEITGEPCPVEADGRAIQQVLVNLIDNAIKHSPSGGSVAVGLDFGPERVHCWVEDSGEGIPVEDHERIFERFYRRGSELRRQTQGVGLGLAIVKYITEAHDGEVSVRSAPGQGSRFTVTLPLSRHSLSQERRC
jgi:signal transduction histidine kinase